MSLTLTPPKSLPAVRSKRLILIIQTNWTQQETCGTCGKSGALLAGLPSYGERVEVILPITDKEEAFLLNTRIWILGKFSVTCNNGLSHSANGLAPDCKFTVSEDPDLSIGVSEEDTSLEKALFRYMKKKMKQ